MCTIVLDVAPDAEVPVVVLHVRDEFVDRAFRAPGKHWPQHPGLVGGQDLQAGGTWAAFDVTAGRFAVLTNRTNPAGPVVDPSKPSRGGLPLLVAEAGRDWTSAIPVADYAPFNLIYADAAGVRSWTWDGSRLQTADVEAGLHMTTAPGIDVGEDERQQWWRPKFEAAPRPAPRSDGAGLDWTGWDVLLDERLPFDDPRAILVRREIKQRSHASTAALRAGLTPTGLLGLEYLGDPLQTPRAGRWQALR